MLKLAERVKSIPVRIEDKDVLLFKLYKNTVNGDIFYTNGSCTDKATGILQIIYTDVKTGKLYNRPLTEWNEVITLEGGKKSPRHILYEM